jgi:hypothetical protein
MHRDFRVLIGVLAVGAAGIFETAVPVGHLSRKAPFLHYWLKIQPVAAADNVKVTVNAAAERQRLEGFGQADVGSFAQPGLPQSLSDSLRAEAIDKAYHWVGINMGKIGALLESPGTWDQRQNDNDDPFTINWRGFNSDGLEQSKKYLLDFAKPLGFTGYFLGGEGPNVRWHSPWLVAIREQNYNRFLEEAAEQVLANVAYWKITHGEELPYYELGNEQASGNRASANPNEWSFGPVNVTQQIVDVVKRAGARLRAAGFSRTRFVVGTEETEEWSYAVASAILSDQKAAQYVGAIGYHTYPYQRGYSSVGFILSTSGAGKPDPGRMRIRNQIRDLARAHHIGAWLDENSNAGNPFLYDTFRARAIHIHDEFLYTNAAAYFVYAPMWDETSEHSHDLSSPGSEGYAVLIHNAKGTVDIAGIGYAIGHYARWAKPGSVRVDALSSDPLIQVTAFRDDATGRLALVLINNSNAETIATITLKGAALGDGWQGEQSTPVAYWQPLPSFTAQDATTLRLSLPATSVTSLGGKMENSPRADEK